MTENPLNELEQLKLRIEKLEIENKHLLNECRLVEEEKEQARKNYYDIISNMEMKVEERTREIKELHRILENQNKELQLIIDTSPYMIFFKDAHLRYIRVNTEFAKSFNLPMKRIISKTINEIFPLHAADFMDDDMNVIKTGKALMNITRELKLPEGSRFLLITKVPYKDIDGNIIGVIGFSIDITDLKRAEREKEELQAKISQMEKMEAIGRLAGSVAHDLNNVLSAVVGYPDLLLMRLPEDSPLRKPLSVMQKSGQKAAAIVEDLLTLARRGVPVIEVLNLNECILNYIQSPEFETLKLYNPGITVKTNLEVNLLNIKGSPVHINKTIMNLVSNAAEATLRKGIINIKTANVHLDNPMSSYDLTISEGEYVVLYVEDNGVGISAEDSKKIFEPFYTKKVMGRSGTGLGMAVVWGTVKDMKGNIDVSSIEGKGSVFTLFFPATTEECEKNKAAIPIKKYLGHNERIIVVDDVLEQREITQSLLSNLNYSVETIASGEEAVRYLQNNSADLIILDMIMDPGIDGLDTYKKILEINPHQKAIITSGFAETDRVREAQKLGVGLYIKKPFTLEKIGLAVRKELDRT